jgi:protein ImuB
VTPRRPPAEIAETLEFPEPVANEHTLARALAALIDRLLTHEARAGRMPRRLAVSAGLVGGGSWRRTATLRVPTAEPERLRLALAPKLADLPAPAIALRLELGELTDSVGIQAELVRPRGSRLRERLREGLRQVRAAAGLEAVCTIVEVAPWSRIPETRAILVPRDD